MELLENSMRLYYLIISHLTFVCVCLPQITFLCVVFKFKVLETTSDVLNTHLSIWV